MVAVEPIPLRQFDANIAAPSDPYDSHTPSSTPPILSRSTTRTMTPTIAARHPPSSLPTKQTSVGLNSAFFLFGLLNNSLYVVILTAALELLPTGVPTGLVSFANIFPALIAKAVWPYVLKGAIRYTKRVLSCAALSFVGMLLVSLFPDLGMRLVGICLASFSSGLGELTFLQLSTRYAPKARRKRGETMIRHARTNYAGDAVGWFASGTGAAGLFGAGAWWVVRPLGVKLGMGILSVLPGFMFLVYSAVLPSVESLLNGLAEGNVAGYAPISTEEDANGDLLDDVDVIAEADDEEDHQRQQSSPTTRPLMDNDLKADPKIRLSFEEKMALLRPMLLPYILPLVTVYFAEYTINQGVSPTLLYALPTRSNHPLLSLIIRKLTDYYPLYQLVYQTFVFLSRSSISMFNLPAIPKRYLWLPAVLQTGLLGLLTSESLYAWFRESIASPLVIVLICIEGLAGGAAYVSVFYSIGVDEGDEHSGIALPSGSDECMPENGESQHFDEDHDQDSREDEENGEHSTAREAQEHEFRIGCVGFGDSLGILAASIISMPLQVGLCNAQVRDGRSLCKQA
ncbi:related to YHC3 - protein involved in vacuolar arginine transport [Melanopsichium pennsylvanicum]|uniref:Protein BTN n=2 Tax=Melanopsichium pennsylvanicum TaxID=63383 RepID=A0AAJ4XRJ0_9BASI|nr:related to YHC3-protein involved in vacuolar arginine transport [Melanopsichium pennsylvanicum 4]SNX87545.1 related to YHC3 - protein involved in vacuolar arginine transport [Melanopsichium pennsylvanicum]